MKYLYVFILFLWITSCNSPSHIEPEANDIEIVEPEPEAGKKITECGADNPRENLPWLKEWIEKAKIDKTGNYLGTIWLVQYKEQNIFVTNMMLGSGGIAYWFFDCSGNYFIHRSGENSHYSPSKYVGNGYVFFEDEKEIFSYISTLQFNGENKNIPVIYSTLPF